MVRRGIFILFTFASSLYASDSLVGLSQKLKEAIDRNHHPLTAVMNFTYSRGRMSTGSYLISERLVTYLAEANVPIIERRLIQTLLAERKMQETGLIDPATFKPAGDVLGVEAVVVGTLSDLSDEETEVMARLIQIQSGKVLGGGTAIVPRVWHDGPRVPRLTQMDLSVPVTYTNLGMTKGSDDIIKHTISEDNRGRRQRYNPAPMPGFVPPRHTMGGFEQ